ncbi:hypothetical protein, partial [Escherichia coli]|uniref:hypothetical protein n=1 Tax=Escherichia coli TaxID=562 RepID=UPI003F767C2F
WKGWAILLRQKQKKLIMLPSETMIWQPEFTDKTLSRKPGAVHVLYVFFLKLYNFKVFFRLKDTTLMSLHNCSEVVLTCYLKMKIIRAALKMS